MKPCLMIMLVAVFTFPLPAEDNPLSSEAQQAWTRTKNYILAAAEKMPEENYSFKPAPESQSFGDLVAHTANARRSRRRSTAIRRWVPARASMGRGSGLVPIPLPPRPI